MVSISTLSRLGGDNCRPARASAKRRDFILASSSLRPGRRDVASGSKESETAAVSFTLVRRLVVAQLCAVFRIQRFRATARRFERQPVPIRKFSQVLILAR